MEIHHPEIFCRLSQSLQSFEGMSTLRGGEWLCHWKSAHSWPPFTAEQLTDSLQAKYLEDSVLQTILIMDKEKLQSYIQNFLRSNLITNMWLNKCSQTCKANSDGPDDTGPLYLDNQIYVPDIQYLWLWILQWHDHPVAGHFRLNRSLTWSTRIIHSPDFEQLSEPRGFTSIQPSS